jgi:preprotein translocase subunit SecF
MLKLEIRMWEKKKKIKKFLHKNHEAISICVLCILLFIFLMFRFYLGIAVVLFIF